MRKKQVLGTSLFSLSDELSDNVILEDDTSSEDVNFNLGDETCNNKKTLDFVRKPVGRVYNRVTKNTEENSKKEELSSYQIAAMRLRLIPSSESCNSKASPADNIDDQAFDLFSGKTFIWYRANRDFVKDWSELEIALRNEFLPTDYDDRFLQEINRRTQLSHQAHLREKTTLSLVQKYFAILSDSGLTRVSSIQKLVQLGHLIKERRNAIDNYVPPARKRNDLEPDLAYVSFDVPISVQEVAAVKNPITLEMTTVCEGRFESLPRKSITAFSAFWERLFTGGEYTIIINATVKHDAFTTRYYKITDLPNQSKSKLGDHFALQLGFSLNNNVKPRLNVHYYYVKLLDIAAENGAKKQTALESYQRETFYYGTIQQAYDGFQWYSAFSPRLYFFEAHTLYLEDLSFRGHRNALPKQFFDFNECRTSLRALARFHANAISYEKYLHNANKDLLKEHPNVFNLNQERLWYKYSLKTMTRVLVALPIAHFIADSFATHAANLLIRYGQIESRCIRTVLHGNLCSSNILFRYDEHNYPQSTAFVDYQLLTHGPVVLDVLNLVYSNTSPSFRTNERLENLLIDYLKHLSDFLGYFQIPTNMTIDDLKWEFDKYKIFYLCQSICEKCVTYIPEEFKGLVVDNTIADYRESLLTSRIEVLKRFYDFDDTFKNNIQNDIHELETIISQLAAT
ncbi:hypothetical protein ILUMI_27066 [Ignelater luminosus]|uniref:CHK kinase-like domain-containing protein n=1 Tax=Ignelater luminosus TaxID=2038154 RepID=A0A8K0FX36_IGNLU|nr:hypothetical protein ILUMI_27066 [Ignelater luminosus]